ncbi:RNA polymerase sigma factor [Agathobaculum sp.]|uniref:RNA polymerase sigma factor n=1 Tax=Agathobaculum sp. TaxID=2048138 RepID=UPI002A817249|nr:RNA polymerase sigma factor [Agathobaculum sp.]MDY3618137.1 RNA polymerase sigma factor [Agathobaculum sp.]
MQSTLRSDAFLCAAMESCGDAVYRLALCRLRSRADAEDVYQEVFLRLIRDTTDFQDGEHLKAWLLRVTLSRCNDLRRSAWFKRTAPIDELPETAAPVPDEHADLWNAVAQLPYDLRIPIHLHYVEGYSTEEIADMVGCRPATVRTRLHRARKQLKLDLEGTDDEYERFAEVAGH